MAAECVIQFREGHVTVEHGERHHAHYRVTAYDKRCVLKLIGVDLMYHASNIIVNQTVRKGRKPTFVALCNRRDRFESLRRGNFARGSVACNADRTGVV